MNTAKGKSPVPVTEETKEEINEIKKQLQPYFEDDSAKAGSVARHKFLRAVVCKREANV